MQDVVVLGTGHWHLPLYREALRAITAWSVCGTSTPKRRVRPWTFPDGPVKRYVNDTAAGDNGHIAVDTRGGVELHAPGQETTQQTVDIDSDALYPLFVEAVATSYDAGFAGMPTLIDVVNAMQPIEAS
jgi:hypothetical protein